MLLALGSVSDGHFLSAKAVVSSCCIQGGFVVLVSRWLEQS